MEKLEIYIKNAKDILANNLKSLKALISMALTMPQSFRRKHGKSCQLFIVLLPSWMPKEHLMLLLRLHKHYPKKKKRDLLQFRYIAMICVAAETLRRNMV